MKYTIENLNFTTENDLETDVVTFYFDVHFTQPATLWVRKQSFGLYNLLPIIKTKSPDIHAYYKKTRSSLDEWGPAEATTLNAMGEEAVNQILKIAQQFFEEADWVADLYEWQLRIDEMSQLPDAAEKEQARIKKIGELAAQMPALKIKNEKSNLFKKEVNNKLRETVVELYPEILEADPEQIRKLKGLFIKEILGMEKTLQLYLKETGI
jgi:hypothetical protein